MTTVVATVQASPVVLDREATIDKVADLTKQAAAEGARLVVFPETFVPTYPDWVWRTTPWADGPWYERLYDESVEIPSAAADRLGAIAAEHDAYLCIGVNERDGGTLYNTLLFYSAAGDLLGKHRKLMATGGERLVWGQGDGSTLVAYDTPFGRLGGLICWENYMPLARAALYGQGVDIYVAPTWDNTDVWVPTLRHIAKEGGCYVVGSTPCMRGADMPAMANRDDLYDDDGWLSRGNSCIVAPGGELLAGPEAEVETILYAEIDPAAPARYRRMFDAVGHYSRADVLRLVVDGAPRQAVAFQRDNPVGEREDAGDSD